MKVVTPSIKLIWMTPEPLKVIERIGRTCYKSEDKIGPGTEIDFVRMLMRRRHMAMIEHASMSYHVVTDRGVSHEFVRHRLFSYAQESTRYCDYGGQEIEFIQPPIKTEDSLSTWLNAMTHAEKFYKYMRVYEAPEIARSVLPNSLKTELVATGNLREWLHFFTLRTDRAAHPQMRHITNLILADAMRRVPVIFDGFQD